MGNQVIRFLVIGGCSTGVDFIVYMLLSLVLPITFAKGIAMIISSICSYIGNKQFTFDDRDRTDIRHLTRFYLVFLFNFSTNLTVNYLLFHFTGQKLVAYILATCAGMIVNYWGQRLFVFSHKYD